MKFVLSCVFAILSVYHAGAVTDSTILAQAYGTDVVEAVVNRIRQSCLFADDRRFLRRLAYVESQDGTAAKTFRTGYYGGIWQVDEAEFDATKNQATLQPSYQIIQDTFGINWNTVTWYELLKPLYSGIAAALYSKLRNNGQPMSWNAEQQGTFWASNFHGGYSKAYNFTQLASILDQGCQSNQQVDLVFLMDTSSSLNADDFVRSIAFIKQFVSGFPISPQQTQVGLVTFDSTPNRQFDLNDYTTLANLQSALSAVAQSSGGTDTGKAIETAVRQVFDPSNGARPYAVKVMIIITDGNSDDIINTRNAADLAHANGIVTFSVGVGGAVDASELETMASAPDCTHVFTATVYEEIKFMREEIQRAACIAPLYINDTYTCTLHSCPPLAVLTGPTGVTLQTNISCDGMLVYTSTQNPYPNSAQYDHSLVTMYNAPGEQYYNISGQTLYINMDNGGLGSDMCVATITPLPGDQTIHPPVVKCFLRGVEVPCLDEYFNCTENWNFKNPCTKENLLKGITKFSHPTDKNKFLMCDDTGKVYIVICPKGEVFFEDCHQCLGENSTVSSNCDVSLSSNLTNPCTRANILAGNMYFEFPGDKRKFIHCDIWGHAWERECPAGEDWAQDILTCYRHDDYDPCRDHVPGTPYLYPHNCDPTKYIHCDTNHQSFTQDCQPGYKFLPESTTCVPDGTYGTDALVNTCPGSGGQALIGGLTVLATTPIRATNARVITSHGPTAYPPGGPVKAYDYDSSGRAHIVPCTVDNINANELYFAYMYDNQHYIQCDLSGYQWFQTCAPNYYDPFTHTCVDGPVFVDNVLGRK